MRRQAKKKATGGFLPLLLLSIVTACIQGLITPIAQRIADRTIIRQIHHKENTRTTGIVYGSARSSLWEVFGK